jgi:hypothetical protein
MKKSYKILKKIFHKIKDNKQEKPIKPIKNK